MRYSYSQYNAFCPVCSNQENTLLFKVSSKEAAMHFLVTHGIDKSNLWLISDKISKIWNKSEAAVVNCKNCDFTFADPYVGGDYEFYNLLPHATDDNAENWKWEFEKTYSKIKNITSNNNDLSFLEIGASTGSFVKRISNIIPKKDIFCLEYSEIGVNSIRKAGIEAHPWNFLDLRNKKEFIERFDIICVFQVLEHLDKLDDTFNTFNSIAKPGCHLFIGVPNGRKIRFNELNDGLLDMPPNHIGRYNKRVFDFLSKRFKWNILEISEEPFSPLGVMKTVMYYRSLKAAQYPPVEKTASYKVSQYLKIKYMRLQSFLFFRQLGDTIWIHLQK